MPFSKGEDTVDDTPRRDLSDLSFQERLAIGLKRIKAQRGWKNKDLASMLGTTEGYMSEVVRGKRDIKLTMLDKMTRIFQVSLHELFDVTEADFQAKKSRRSVKLKT